MALYVAHLIVAGDETSLEELTKVVAEMTSTLDPIVPEISVNTDAKTGMKIMEATYRLGDENDQSK